MTMRVEVDGKFQVVPKCTCGKCLVKRLRKEHFLSYPYSKNLGTTYSGDYTKKPAMKPNWKDDFYNKSKQNGFDGCYREHIPTSLISTQKMDFRPFTVKAKEFEPKRQVIHGGPFFGNTTYNNFYKNWGPFSDRKAPIEKLPDIKVPFRGNTNYRENYIKYPKDNYDSKDTLIYPKSTLEFYGKLNPDTTYGCDYLPIDFNQPHYFNKDQFLNKAKFENSSFVPAEFPPSNFESLYKTDYVDRFKDDGMCELRKWLNARGKAVLEI